MREPQNLVGQKFGKLTVLEFDHKDETSRKRFWKCRCDCGNIVVVYQNHLKSGHTKSCGCSHNRDDINVKHGCCRRKVAKERLYKIWIGMKTRCLNKNSNAYDRYGGRGITICDEWLDFSVFKDWAMNHGYKNDLSIDRIDVNGDYRPENCRWADNTIQANNRRNSSGIEFNGEIHTIAEWTRIYNLPQGIISTRINKLGWSPEKAITTPARKRKEVKK